MSDRRAVTSSGQVTGLAHLRDASHFHDYPYLCVIAILHVILYTISHNIVLISQALSNGRKRKHLDSLTSLGTKGEGGNKINSDPSCSKTEDSPRRRLGDLELRLVNRSYCNIYVILHVINIWKSSMDCGVFTACKVITNIFKIWGPHAISGQTSRSSAINF